MVCRRRFRGASSFPARVLRGHGRTRRRRGRAPPRVVALQRKRREVSARRQRPPGAPVVLSPRARLPVRAVPRAAAAARGRETAAAWCHASPTRPVWWALAPGGRPRRSWPPQARPVSRGRGRARVSRARSLLTRPDRRKMACRGREDGVSQLAEGLEAGIDSPLQPVQEQVSGRLGRQTEALTSWSRTNLGNEDPTSL